MVTWHSSTRAWGAVARLLHWGMAVALLGQLVLGWVAVSWHLSPTKLELFVWHKTLGISLLALVILRLIWRLVDGRPEPAPGPLWQQRLARGSHALLYLLMLAIPVSGWVIQSASGFPFKLFAAVELPALVERSKSVQNLAESIHLGLFWLFAALILAHVGAALHHHWGREDATLRRMVTGRGG
jgi:cytochrome b561